MAIAKFKDEHGSGAMQTAFLKEVGSLTKLDHPNILRPHGFCVNSDELLLVLPLCPRSVFDAYRGDLGSLDGPTRLKVMQQLASAVAYLHGQTPDPIVHRDLKSPNVLLTGENDVQLIDFGLSETQKIVSVQSSMSSSKHHVANPTGTVPWMAPEVAAANTSKKKNRLKWMPADVFSMGMVFYELATNKIPWESMDGAIGIDELRESFGEGERLDSDDQLTAEAVAAVGLPEAVLGVIAGCWGGLKVGEEEVWHNEPEKRPTAQEVADTLAGMSASTPTYFPSEP